MTNFLFLLGAHFIGDICLQTDTMANQKSKRFYLLLAHAVVYGTVVSLMLFHLGVFADWKFPLIILSHIIVDSWKSKQPRTDDAYNLVYVDQGIHIGINTILAFVV